MKGDSFADLPLRTLLEHIASARIAPGSGAAGAITLALGAACAAKAVSITLKRASDDPRLQRTHADFEALARHAVRGAEVDSEAFEQFIHDNAGRGAAGLIMSGHAIARLIQTLDRMIEDVEPLIDPGLAGDLIAAKALAIAAKTIQSSNEAELAHRER